MFSRMYKKQATIEYHLNSAILVNHKLNHHVYMVLIKVFSKMLHCTYKMDFTKQLFKLITSKNKV